MYWTAYYSEQKYVVSDNKSKKLDSKKMIGIFIGGNSTEIIEKVCHKIGYPVRFDPDKCKRGVLKYLYVSENQKDDNIFKTHHKIRVAPLGEMIKIGG